MNDTPRPEEAPPTPPLPASSPVLPRDPEEAQRALTQVQELLRRFEVVREQARHEAESLPRERRPMVEQVAVSQHLWQLQARLERLHPADVAYILEALPRDQRLRVWRSERITEVPMIAATTPSEKSTGIL